MNVLACLITMAIGYLLGSIPTGVIIGRLFYHKDPRDYYSHNSGGTNSGRVFGPVGGVVVIVLDIVKTLVAFYICYTLMQVTPWAQEWNLFDGGRLAVWLSLFGATLGHCFSIFLGFGGGKAVSCFMGAAGGTSYVTFVFCFIAFFSALALKKKVVSFASLVAGGMITLFDVILSIIAECSQWNTSILMWDFGTSGWLSFGWQCAVTIVLCYAVLVVRHIPNIKRLRSGTEKPAHWVK